MSRNMSRTSLALGNLRAFVILLVAGFHSSLAYVVFQPPLRPFSSPPWDWRAFPILDHVHWFGLDLFCAFQYVFLMPFMFFLSGLFVWQSIARKGVGAFLSDRLVRIGIPFALGVYLLMPVAHYPVYRLTAPDPSLSTFWAQWIALPFWASGRPSCPVFRRAGDRLRACLSAAGCDLPAVGLASGRAVCLPARPRAALRGLFLRRCRRRHGRDRTRPAAGGRTAAATLGALVRARARGVSGVDAGHRVDNGERPARHRTAAAARCAREPRLRTRERDRLLRLRCGLPALRRKPQAGRRQPVRQCLRDLSGALSSRDLASIPAARPSSAGRRQGGDGFRRGTACGLERDGRDALHAYRRPRVGG